MPLETVICFALENFDFHLSTFFLSSKLGVIDTVKSSNFIKHSFPRLVCRSRLFWLRNQHVSDSFNPWMRLLSTVSKQRDSFVSVKDSETITNQSESSDVALLLRKLKVARTEIDFEEKLGKIMIVRRFWMRIKRKDGSDFWLVKVYLFPWMNESYGAIRAMQFMIVYLFSLLFFWSISMDKSSSTFFL